uniref:Uncharacterized protein n=1 Tax=Timema genevievae TaxID=629358 RepID=A0A7R9JUN3_TIMGE|nr:unnamed protein product [Timema genevievae]
MENAMLRSVLTHPDILAKAVGQLVHGLCHLSYGGVYVCALDILGVGTPSRIVPWCVVNRTRKGMSRRHSSGSGGGNKKPPDISLLMECYDEEPTKEQQAAYNKGEREYQEVVAKLEKYVKSMEAEMIEKISDQTYVLQMNATGNAPNPVVNVTAATPTTKVANTPLTRQQAAMIPQPPPNSNIVQTPNGPNSPQQASGVVTRGSSANTLHTAGGTYQLIRLGTPVIQSTTSLASKTTPITQVTSSRSNIQTRTRGQITPTHTPPGQKTPVAAPKQNLVPLTPVGRGRGKPSITMPRPTESNSVGGLSAGSNKPKSAPPGSAPIVDLTDDDTRPTGSGNVAADSREVTFNKLSGKTFPSLVVVARPNLRVKLIPQSTVTQERTELDTKVKSVLMFTPTKFTEWLIQKGLVRSEQYCATHLTADSPPVRLKLGMYSDVSKFPYSGGYVWISECCPQRFVSVFHGSIFEGAPHPPTVLLKLMYHWSCQTNVQNVVQWVKVDNFYVKNFFSNMRSVCTAAVHEKYEKMGGPRKKIEVGVISLGTTSQDGNMRQVKVEVLGVMDHENNLIRLRAVEPLQDGERNYKRRFVKILEPLDQWVDKESSILTDFTVDKGTLHSMGFNQVYQVSVNEAPSTNNKFSNHNVMEYLRRIVPRMFQNTLSLLSRQIIQQFLDELVWRERWGPVPSQAFDNIIQHMAEQTKLDTGPNMSGTGDTALLNLLAQLLKNDATAR